MKKLMLIVALVLSATLSTAPVPSTAQSKGIVNVYSARTYSALEPVFAKFTKDTGIQVRLSQGSVQSLVERLRAEGKATPADVFFSIDAGGLELVAEENLLQPIESEVLTKNVPAELRDAKNRWFGLSRRTRTIVYNPAKVKPEELSTYEALADTKWSGRLCLRPATHIYTISLTASLVASLGAEKTEAVMKGIVENKPQFIDSDTKILETIAAGGCDVGLTNHYYLARKLSEDPKFTVKLFWANQGEKDRGVHVNISGAGVTASAVNKDNAVKFIEWLSNEGQGADAEGLPGGNYEFPVKADAKLHPIIEGFGKFKADTLALSEYGKNQKAALQLLEKVKYGF